MVLHREVNRLTSRVSGKERILHCSDARSFVGRQESNLPLSFIMMIMPLFLIVLGASGIGAALALYIMRKYDDPNT